MVLNDLTFLSSTDGHSTVRIEGYRIILLSNIVKMITPPVLSIRQTFFWHTMWTS